MAKKSKKIDRPPHDPITEITIDDLIEANGEPGVQIADFRNRHFQITPQDFMSMTAFTSTYAVGKYDAKVDTYTIKRYEKDDFNNLIQLLTLWIDDEAIKLRVKEIAETFEGDEFSEEDIDKFILSITLNIEDEKIRNRFEETHQYWKNIVR